MRVKIEPAYLGFSAGQSKRSKQRGKTTKIWMTRDGLRLPVVKMTDYHLICAIYKMRLFALNLRDNNLEDKPIEKIIREHIPTFPLMVKEGYKRGLVHSNSYPESRGWKLLGKGKEKKYCLVYQT